jgi:hypothetical protein
MITRETSSQRTEFIGQLITLMGFAPSLLLGLVPLSLVAGRGWRRCLALGVLPYAAVLTPTIYVMNQMWSDDGEFESAVEPYRSFIWCWSRLQVAPIPLFMLVRSLLSSPFSVIPGVHAGNSAFSLSSRFHYYDKIFTSRPGVHIFLGGLPAPSHLDELHRQGVRGVVNCCEEFSGWTSQMKRLGIQQHSLNVVDYCTVPEDKLAAAVVFIRDQFERGFSVYIHCKAGVGRSGTVAVAYLAKYHIPNPSGSKEKPGYTAFCEVRNHRRIDEVYERPAVQAVLRSRL